MKIVIADAAVSIAPPSWRDNKSINRYYRKYSRMPIVDASKHQHLLNNIPPEERFDRPDILHFGLLTILGYSSLLQPFECYFGTKNGYYSIDPKTRLPRSQNRFYGILEQILSGQYKGSHINPVPEPKYDIEKTTFFSPKGRSIKSVDYQNDIFVFGGFAHGTYRSITPPKSNLVRLVNEPLDLWTSLSLFINDYIKNR